VETRALASLQGMQTANNVIEMQKDKPLAISMRGSKEEYETIRHVSLANKRKMSDFCRIAAMEAAQQYLDAHPEDARAKRKSKTVA
jgi:uncharacterized protein (DUF1778 family)